jgi:hypothetical protein
LIDRNCRPDLPSLRYDSMSRSAVENMPAGMVANSPVLQAADFCTSTVNRLPGPVTAKENDKHLSVSRVATLPTPHAHAYI